jgi:hypothetical protein
MIVLITTLQGKSSCIPGMWVPTCPNDKDKSDDTSPPDAVDVIIICHDAYSVVGQQAFCLVD